MSEYAKKLEILEWVRQSCPQASMCDIPDNTIELEIAMEQKDCYQHCPGISDCKHRGYIYLPVLYPYSVSRSPYYKTACAPCKVRVLAAKKAAIETYVKNCGIPQLFKHATFENFTTIRRTPKIGLAKSMAQDCVAQELALTLMGTPGTGKTHLAAAMVHAWLAKGKSAIFIPVVTLLDEIRRGYGPYSPLPKIEDAIKSVDFVALDDLGAQKDNDWVTERLWELIDQRYRERKPITITSNAVSKDHLVTIAGERGPQIVSRLTDQTFGHYIALEDIDYRSLKRQDR